ncbi:hypothetical protein [Alicyclobacillus tolerans]|uniref:Lipoprotein n=1 Tax=Alicyclobacillus tolerans TaxID=90970 RepID=A0A1M6TY29_9BACL|nr:hypothetical protein [Alicyclobacillus montanus]SHK61811.1 hypothetical protein SAMN05443507_1181 [Alicyclobacillus montanus]
MKRYKKWTTAGIALTIVGLLTGCGTGGGVSSGSTPTKNITNTTSTNNTSASISSNNTVVTANLTNQTKMSSTSLNQTGTKMDTFPALIQEGMQQISGKTSLPLYAPTIYPGSAHTPVPVTVSTNIGSSPTSNYSIMFNRNNLNIGGFSMSDWSTTNTASQHLLPENSSLYIQTSVPSVSTIGLGNGIQAEVKKSPVQGKNVSALVWNEWRWTMQVLYPTSSQSEAITIAKKIVQYCHYKFLPVPDTKGYVLTNLASGYATIYVAWNKGQYVFNTNSNGTWNSNSSGGYLSALEMAVSMTPYK